MPLLLSRQEFARSLDVFPVEYGEIVANHVTIVGDDPFAGATIAEADLRRSCELQAKSHLIHLREGFLEAGGDLARDRLPDRLVDPRLPRAARQHRAARSRAGRRRPPRTGDASLAHFAERTIGVPAAT